VPGIANQQMQLIDWVDVEPSLWHPEALPDVDDVRPLRCPGCGAPAKQGGRIVLHGHGRRERQVVVLPALGDTCRVVGECWSRRYRCTLCGSVPTVLPRGVLPRFLYSALAIVVSFALVGQRPVGEGLSDAEAYDLQGMNPSRRWTKPWPYRWRSLDRWQSRIASWWWGLGAEDLEGLLVGLSRRAGGSDLRQVLAVAVASHVRWGAAM